MRGMREAFTKELLPSGGLLSNLKLSWDGGGGDVGIPYIRLRAGSVIEYEEQYAWFTRGFEAATPAKTYAQFVAELPHERVRRGGVSINKAAVEAGVAVATWCRLENGNDVAASTLLKVLAWSGWTLKGESGV